MNERHWKQLNRMLLTATLLTALVFGMLLMPPLMAAITYLMSN